MEIIIKNNFTTKDRDLFIQDIANEAFLNGMSISFNASIHNDDICIYVKKEDITNEFLAYLYSLNDPNVKNIEYCVKNIENEMKRLSQMIEQLKKYIK